LVKAVEKPAIDFVQHLGDADRRQHCVDPRSQRLGFGRCGRLHRSDVQSGPGVSTDAEKLLEESLLSPTWPGSTATRAAIPKPTTSSRRFTAGSPKASTQPI
jgi:hypothetical protein